MIGIYIYLVGSLILMVMLIPNVLVDYRMDYYFIKKTTWPKIKLVLFYLSVLALGMITSWIGIICIITIACRVELEKRKIK